MKTLLILAAWLFGVALLYHLFTRGRRSRLVRERVFTTRVETLGDRRPEVEDPFLTAWLSRAGFRTVGSASAFVLATVLSTLLGVVLGLVLHYSGLIGFLSDQAFQISEGVGSLVSSFLILVPWGIFLFLALGPWLYVRGVRRNRVMLIERELPMVLELFATLSAAGLGFDASFTKILENEREESPLVTELRTFQLETLAGTPRVRCFRRLTRRCEIASMTIFCSAMIQAEQVGSGYSSVLRTQADDLRARRREHAMIQAQALPVKLVFPLVICFLPGIFVTTLGPAFMEFAEIAGGVIGGR